MSDADEPTTADLKRVRLLRKLLRAAGYQRNKHGFWTPDAVGIRSEAVPDDDNEDESDD